MKNYDGHLTEKDVGRLLQGRMAHGATWAAHLHLLQCRLCRVNLFVYDEALAGLHLDDVYGAGTGAAWRRQLEEPVDTLSYQSGRLLELAELTPREIWFRALNVPAFQDVGTLAAMVESAHAMRKDAPEDAEIVLDGAIRALERQKDWPSKERGILLAQAWAYLGNIHRIFYRFTKAAEAFATAGRLLEGCQAAPEALGEVAWLRGGLYRDQRNYEDAIRELQWAVEMLPRTGQSTTQLDAMITLANCYGEAGQVTESIATLKSLIERFPRSMFSPGTFLSSLQSLVLGYAQTGQPEKAKALLPKVRRLAEEEGNRLDLLRVQWAEAEVYKAEGKRTLAAAEFRDVTSKFLAAKIPVDAALATLSQAEMYLDLGDTRAAAELAEVLVPIFRSKGIHREAAAAGLIVVEDLRREAATAGQVQELVERLQGVGARRPPSHTS